MIHEFYALGKTKSPLYRHWADGYSFGIDSADGLPVRKHRIGEMTPATLTPTFWR